MKPFTTRTIMVTILGLAALLAAKTPARVNEPVVKEGVEVMARGPVHEAFAAPSLERPLPTQVVPKKPPDPIEELPPDEKPAGEHVIWIPGYWAWDEEAKGFLWISGFWRVPPPGRQWMPGNWQETEDGWQWTSGFWSAADLQEVTYLPAPPPSIDQGPSTPAPDANSTYVQGCWMHRESRYLWRPGFWLGFQPDWVWIPAHYVWTPGGYVFVDGFWDRPFERRGFLFAPIRVAPALLATPWTYVPQYVVQPDFLMGALFVRPSHCHYYFGDYFEAGYRRSGFVPWCDYRGGRESYDPNFAFYRHHHGDPGWERNLRGYYAGRTSGEIPRPPRTLIQQNTVINNYVRNNTTNVNVSKNIAITHNQNVNALTSITKLNNTRVTGLGSLNPKMTGEKKAPGRVLKVETMPREQRAEALRAVTQSRAIGQQRHLAEVKIVAGHAAPVKATDSPRVVKVQAPQGTPVRPSGPPPPKPPVPPPAPKQPAHVVKPIPPHEPPAPVRPPASVPHPAPPSRHPATPTPHPAPPAPHPAAPHLAAPTPPAPHPAVPTRHPAPPPPHAATQAPHPAPRRRTQHFRLPDHIRRPQPHTPRPPRRIRRLQHHTRRPQRRTRRPRRRTRPLRHGIRRRHRRTQRHPAPPAAHPAPPPHTPRAG